MLSKDFLRDSPAILMLEYRIFDLYASFDLQ